MIEIDPGLTNGAINDTDTYGYGSIFVSPSTLNNGGRFLTHLMAHELGHSLGFENNWGSNCATQTIMYGGISESGPFFASIPTCDANAVAETYSTSEPDPPPPPPDEQQHICVSPIVIDTAGNGYRITGLGDGVLFDLRAEGVARRVAWTYAGSDDAFLALDRDLNGSVDHGGELFGDFTRLVSGARARNGFEALSEFDDNRDGVVDHRDSVWQRLLLWTDRDHNGTSSIGELQVISESSIIALETSYQAVGRSDQWNNYFRYMSHLRVRRGPSERRMTFYDIYLRLAE